MKIGAVDFPAFSGVRCLMMPYIQGDADSVPAMYAPYREILGSTFIDQGEIGFLTIDESFVADGMPHRGARAKTERALHTEAGRTPGKHYAWGNWGSSDDVRLDADVEILLANNISNSCAVWDAVHADTSRDGDIGHVAHLYPYEEATLMQAGEVFRIGILTPHESLRIAKRTPRQFLRIVSSGVHGREPYFTINPLLS